MDILITIVAFLIIFSVLILIHECGHFFAAKKSGVKVEEFGFGLPPRMFGIKRGETIYSINWIPFGGFVRMLGEDSTTKKSKASKRSFENQSLRTQAFIVCAGVIMNLLLAFVLLTFGFVVGIEPLLSSEDDFLNAIRSGNVLVEPGIVVTETGDRILDFDGIPIETVEQWDEMVDFVDAGGIVPLLDSELLDTVADDLTYLPRLVYLENQESVFAGLLQTGDALIQINGEEILDENDLYTSLSGVQEAVIGFYRAGVGEFEVTLPLPEYHPIITYVEPGAPSALAGIQAGDQIISVDGVEVNLGEEVTAITEAKTEGTLTYGISRGEENLTFTIKPRAADNLIGIAMSDVLPSYGNLSLYSTYVPHTLIETEKVSYGWAAPKVAVQEMWRLSKTTAVMFVNVLQKFLTGAEVPAGVSGPVGIAQMTFVTVQDGFTATLRFMALLSLSLGVINILPFPALDGGKFFFILLEGITGRKLNSKYEHLIHGAGFIFLMLFILYVTFNDVLNLF